MCGLKRREADAISDGHGPYDALLDQYEPGARGAELAPSFAALTERLGPLVAAGTARRQSRCRDRHWPRPAQLQLAHDIAELIGFNFAEGRIGESAHPFSSSSGIGDVRFTTRDRRAQPDQQRAERAPRGGPRDVRAGVRGGASRASPLWDAPSLGSHEAQARFWENHVGGTLAFWQVIEPRMRELFPEAMRGLGARDFHAATATVRPSLIRVEADEVTYNLHIVLRFELERALIAGDLEVADLPEAWNARMKELLGIVPSAPADGVMQDVHWPSGLFGYFPTYTLGNLYAAQLAAAADSELGGLEAAIAHGAL